MIKSDYREFSTLNDKLDQPELYPVLAENKEMLLNQYETMLEILGQEGAFKVRDLYIERTGPNVEPTFGICHKNEDGEWIYLEPYLQSVRNLCSNKHLDYIFELQPQGDLLVGDSTMKPKIKGNMTRREFFSVEGEEWKRLSDHVGVSTVVDL